MLPKAEATKPGNSEAGNRQIQKSSAPDSSTNGPYRLVTPKSEFAGDAGKTSSTYQEVSKSAYMDLAKPNSGMHKFAYDNVKYGMDSTKLGYLDPMNVAYLEAAKSAAYFDVSRSAYNQFDPAKSSFLESGKLGYLEQGKAEYINQGNIKNNYMRQDKSEYLDNLKPDQYNLQQRAEYCFDGKQEYLTGKNHGFDVLQQKPNYTAQVKVEYPMMQHSPKSGAERAGLSDPLASLTSHSSDVSHQHAMMTPSISMSSAQQHVYSMPAGSSPKSIPLSMEGASFSSLRVSEPPGGALHSVTVAT